ncbi:hypothetical protein ACI798_15375 [Geodermatophilus sp. SYSU D01045]
MTAPEDPRERFRTLPEPVDPQDAVEEVDTAARPLRDDGDERDALLRQAGG